jgi:Tfp pilus assembly protein PilF
MLKTKFAPLLVVALLVCLSSVVRAQRPGFYSGSFPGSGSSREPAGPRGESGPMRHGYGWPRQHSGVDFYLGVGPGYYRPPVYGHPYYYPRWGYGYGTGIYFDPATNTAEYYLPPIYSPAELNYGPLAIERFLGIRRNPIVMPPSADAAPDAADKDVTPAEVADKLRKSNNESRARGKRFIEFGDALFLRQRFNEALQRYKSAIEAAPDLVDAYMREGFALIAVNQYRLATKALKIAVELDPEFVKSGFRLDDLYGANRLAETSHLETLAREALENPDDADLLFLVGMMLHADGEPERARRFLGKAAELGGPEAARLLSPLLETEAPAEAVPAVQDNAAGIDT